MNCFTTVSFICRFPVRHRQFFLKMLCFEWTLTFLLRLLLSYPDVHWSLLLVMCSCFCTQELKCTDVTQFYTYFHFKENCLVVNLDFSHYVIFFSFILFYSSTLFTYMYNSSHVLNTTLGSFYRTDWFSFYLTKGFLFT